MMLEYLGLRSIKLPDIPPLNAVVVAEISFAERNE